MANGPITDHIVPDQSGQDLGHAGFFYRKNWKAIHWLTSTDLQYMWRKKILQTKILNYLTSFYLIKATL